MFRTPQLPRKDQKTFVLNVTKRLVDPGNGQYHKKKVVIIS